MAQKSILLWIAVAIFAQLSATSTRAEVSASIVRTVYPDNSATNPTNSATTRAPNTEKTGAPNTEKTGAPNTEKTGAPSTEKTGAPNTGTTASSGTLAPPTTSTDPCNPNPCGGGSTCEPRANQTFTCSCLTGDFYYTEPKQCLKAKVFPGQVQLSKIPYEENMKDPKSMEFKETVDKIIRELDNVFKKDSTYSGSTVLALMPSTNVVSRSGTGVTASVQIVFSANSPIKEDQVIMQIKTHSCTDCVLNGETFEESTLCAQEPCDTQSTTCTSANGLYSCLCLDGFIKTNFSTRMCTLACPYGQELKGGKCVSCPFGYSGLNCRENGKLVLVIVGSVLGGLLLIALILLPVVATQKSKKSSKKNKDAGMEKPYQTSDKAPFASSGLGKNQADPFKPANGQPVFPVFPRVAASSWDSRTNLEMTPSNNRQNFDPMGRSSRIYDEPEDINLYSQARPQNNPYAINRPKINPYAQNQGHSNPYYAHDDGRRFY